MVLPHGVLFRGGAEGRIREGLLREDLVEAVVGLGPNLFYGSGIPACIVIMNRAKPAERKGKVLFIHGADELVEGKAQNYLSDENIARMAGAFHAWKDEERFCRVVDLDEIEKNDFNLNIPRYVDTTEPEEEIDVAAELAAEGADGGAGQGGEAGWSATSRSSDMGAEFPDWRDVGRERTG